MDYGRLVKVHVDHVDPQSCAAIGFVGHHAAQSKIECTCSIQAASYSTGSERVREGGSQHRASKHGLPPFDQAIVRITAVELVKYGSK
jgi:hypothetical protein